MPFKCRIRRNRFGLPGVQHEVVVVIKSQVSRPSKRQDLTPKQTSKGKT